MYKIFSVFVMALFSCLILVQETVASDNLNVFFRKNVVLMWPVKGVRFARDPNQVDRATKVYPIKHLHKEHSQGRIEIGSIVADFSGFSTHANLDGICVLTNRHFSGHRKNYRRKFGENILDIPIVDQYATRSGRSFSLQLDASLDAGILANLFPSIKLSGLVNVKFKSSNARDRFIEKKHDRDFLYKIVRNGPICSNRKIPQYRYKKKYFVDNFTYGDFVPEIRIKANFFGFGSELVVGETLYGAFLFRPGKRF